MQFVFFRKTEKLLELAKLEFNIFHSIQQRELKHVSRLWFMLCHCYIYIYIFFKDEFGFEWSNIRFLCADGGQIGVSLNWHSVGIVAWNTTLWPLALPLTPNILHSDLDLPNWVMWQRFSTISTTPSEGWTSSKSLQRKLKGGTEISIQFNKL